MQRRKWDAKTKALIVLEGLKGKSVAEICTEHQISQSLYYQWRDQFLANAANAFEAQQHSRREARLAQESVERKPLVGALLLEGNQSDEPLG
jgi:transposase-like protein